MQEFLEFTLGGISAGMIYAAIALSLVLIWRGTRILNYAQGGMAMFTAYIALIVIQRTGNYWAGFAAALAAGLVLGAVLGRVVVRAGAGGGPGGGAGGGSCPAGARQAAAERGHRVDRPAHLHRGPGRHHLRRPVPVLSACLLHQRAEHRLGGAGHLLERRLHRWRRARRCRQPGRG